jgi:antitoxin component YwqK of YwqJK toxin-antitoxin module
MYECPMLNGQYNGVCKEWNQNGKLNMISRWKNGKRDGLSTQYYSDGSLHTKFWFKDDQQTKYVSYHKNGKRRVVYISSKMYKKHIIRNTKGQMVFMQIQQGLEQEPVSNPEDCNCGNENITYRDSMLIDRTGLQLNKKVKFKTVMWYDNGKMKAEDIYQNGKGVFRSYDMNGNLIREEKY